MRGGEVSLDGKDGRWKKEGKLPSQSLDHSVKSPRRAYLTERKNRSVSGKKEKAKIQQEIGIEQEFILRE